VRRRRRLDATPRAPHQEFGMGSEPDSFKKLGPEALVMFARGLAGLPPEEVRQLKRLYVKNTVTDLRAEIGHREAGFRAGCIHWLIPLFWPFAWAERSSISVAKRRGRELVANLREAWSEDLRGLELDLTFLEG